MDKEKLINILNSMRISSHYECEDEFYSCPAHPDYFGNNKSRKCNCGMEDTNKKIEEAIIIVNQL